MEMSSGGKKKKTGWKMKKLLRIIIVPILCLAALPLKFLGTCQALTHFVILWTNQPQSNWRPPLKKPTQNQSLQLGTICKEEKADMEKLALCFYSSRADTQQLMLSFSGHIIGLLIAAVIKALMKPHEHPDHTKSCILVSAPWKNRIFPLWSAF